jgi:hypothetical protein
MPASRTQISAHSGRSSGNGFDLALSFPLETEKASTI